jgi:hypothetical protein
VVTEEQLDMNPFRRLLVASVAASLVAVACQRHEPAGGGPVAAPAQPPTRQHGADPDQLVVGPGAVPRPAGACGRTPGEPIQPTVAQYGAGNPECDRAATVWANVLHADRTCQSDADCVIVSGGQGGCFSAALNRTGAAKPEYRAFPCGSPTAGACGPTGGLAGCAQGCCVPR